jgi:50S ribosomal protein L16 3-hydroxylase
MMLDLVQQPEHFQHWFGEFISQTRHELDAAPPEPPYQAGEIYELLQQGEPLQRLGGLRVLRVGDQCFVNGELIDTEHLQAADALCQHFSVNAAMLGEAIDDPSFLATLTALINSGYWYFND